jgi:hypothetical protein
MALYRIGIPLVVASLVVAAGGATIAEAQDPLCRGSLVRMNFPGDLRVPANATCRLSRSQVRRDLVVARGATLIADGVGVARDVVGNGARRVTVTNSLIGDDVDLSRGGSASVLRTTLGGDVEIERLTGSVVVSRNQIGADIEIRGNRGRVEIRRNAVGEDLTCSGNRRMPVGGGNAVGGDREGQCRGL